MKKLFISFFGVFILFGLVNFSFAQECNTKEECQAIDKQVSDNSNKGKDDCKPVKLNTNVPFIGNQIETCEGGDPSKTTIGTAFPRLMGGVSKLLITLILIVGFLMIVVGGVMITASGVYKDGKKGKELILKVIVGIILLGMSGIILNVINPNFFK